MTKLSFRLNSNSGRILLVHLFYFEYSSSKHMATRLTRGNNTFLWFCLRSVVWGWGRKCLEQNCHFFTYKQGFLIITFFQLPFSSIIFKLHSTELCIYAEVLSSQKAKTQPYGALVYMHWNFSDHVAWYGKLHSCYNSLPTVQGRNHQPIIDSIHLLQA